MKEKELYLSPETEVIEIKLEGTVLVASPNPIVTNPFEGITEEEWS